MNELDSQIVVMRNGRSIARAFANRIYCALFKLEQQNYELFCNLILHCKNNTKLQHHEVCELIRLFFLDGSGIISQDTKDVVLSCTHRQTANFYLGFPYC